MEWWLYGSSIPIKFWLFSVLLVHDDVIKWKHFPRNWPFVRGIRWSPVNSPHKGQWRRALMFFFICVWINDWVNNPKAGDLRRYCTHYDVIVMPKERILQRNKDNTMAADDLTPGVTKTSVAMVSTVCHSVESPSTVDPQWDIWYWGSKWNLHTVCWSAVGCEWGTTSVYFGITYVCFIPSRLPVFAVEPQYLLQDFLFLSKVSFEGHIQNLQKISCWFKIWMGFVGPKLIELWTSSIWGFL